MSQTINEQKAEIRQRCKATRQEMDAETRQQASVAICGHLADWDIFLKSEIILTYMPLRAEVNLLPLLTQFPEKRWLIPRILPGETGQMVFHPYDTKHLVRHPFGMEEPASYLPQVSPAEVQLVLAPGLAFDRSGWRLGYGGGYYDRFLSGFDGVSVGVTYRALFLDELPHGEFDIPITWVVHERGIIRTACSE